MPLSARVLPILPSAAQMAVSCCATANLKDWLSNQGNASVLGIRISSERNVLLSVGAGPTLFDGNRGHEVTPFVESALSCNRH